MTFRRILTSTLALLLLASVSFAQDKISAKDKFSIQEAHGAFISGDYEYALSVYNQYIGTYPNNAILNYRIGYCYTELNNTEDAIKYYEKVQTSQLKKKHFDFYFGWGKALQKQGRYQTALAKYQEFEKKGRKKDKDLLEVERFIKQCQFAIKATQSPVSVQISPVGDAVNSPYDDYHPMVTIDGQMMVFTSRRSCKKNDEQLQDGQYYDKIYYTKWDAEAQAWGEAKLMEGKLNSKEYDANTGISSDGKLLLTYKNIDSNNKKGFSGIGSGDVLMSKLGKNNLWGRPKLVEGLNSSFYDGGACFSPDGTKIFFISDRMGILYKGSVGGRDIWYSELKEDKTWSKPKNLGDVVNSAYDERAVYMHPDGKTLFFSSEGHDEQNMGGYDVFKTEFKDGKWTKPVNLGFPINTSSDEKEFILSADKSTAWISARKEAKNRIDVFQIDMRFYDVIAGKSAPLSIVRGKLTDGSTGLAVSSTIKFTNKATQKVIEVNSNKNGEYVTPLESNATYIISVNEAGYNAYSKEHTLTLPAAPKKSKKKKRLKRGEKEKAMLTADVHSTELNLQLERTVALNITNKNLFTPKTLRFVGTGEGYQLNEFSQNILAMFAEQMKAEAAVKLEVTAHYDDDSNDEQISMGKSKNLAKIITDYLKAQEVNMDNVQVLPMGNTEPMADPDTAAGKKLNRRVEVRILL